MSEEQATGNGGEKAKRTRRAPEYIVQVKKLGDGNADFGDRHAPEVLNSPESAAEYAQEAAATVGFAMEFRTVRIVDEGIVRPVTTATIERAKGYKRSR